MRPIQFPDWLYYSPRVQSKSVSPVATLDPCANSDAWSCSTTPGAQKKTKTIIITQDSIAGISKAEFIAFAQFMKHPDQGFSLILAVREGLPTDPIYDHYNRLGSFNSDVNYKIIAEKYGISRDHLVVLTAYQMRELFVCLQPSLCEITSKALAISHNAFTLRINALSDEDQNKMNGLVLNSDHQQLSELRTNP